MIAGHGSVDTSSLSIRETFTALALTVASPLCLLDVQERFKSVVTANDHQVSTRVPGPCPLWHSGAAEDETYRELLIRLAGTPAATSTWIVGPDDADYEVFVECLSRNSPVIEAVR